MSVVSPVLNRALTANDVAAAEKAWSNFRSAELEELVPSLGDQLAETGGSLTVEMARWLIAKGVSTTGMHEQSGAGLTDWLSRAIGAKNTDLVRWLIQDQGVDPNRQLPHNGPIPLMEAMKISKWDMGELLLELGARLDAGNRLEQTPLHIAAAAYKVQAMVWLIEHGADPTLQDQHGHCPAELIPQEPGPEWRPDDTYEWLTASETASPNARKVIPPHIRDEALVEKIGLKFTAKPEEEWTEDDKRVNRVLIERGVIEAPIKANFQRRLVTR